ncbi:phage tail protein [Phyllobacterium phragmitis]|uniref:Phage tail protein n=1 Tax=Phyllobacterium phragmitis TaxID=2670329 RepID=A0A2S9IK27_9HYPH|nr:tail protein X [Phyllobacterium phragmitis]PRD40865.1 phage tail protein [Phyllobacterium phragmitis]
MPETVTIRGEDMTLDLILWRRFGVRGQSLVEQALEINPGLAELGPYIPLGTVVTLPDLPPEQSAPRRHVVSLFG